MVDRKEGNKIITSMVKMMVEMGGALIVDNKSMVHYSDKPDEPLLLQGNMDKIPKKLYIYNTNIDDPEAVILNPLSESAATNKERMVFYLSLSSLTSQWLQRIMLFIIEEAVKGKTDGVTDTHMVNLLSPFIDKVDKKMVDELHFIAKSSHKEFCNIYYNKTKKTSGMHMGVEDPTEEYIKSFPTNKVRKMTWKVITSVLKYILKVPDDKTIEEVYTTSTNNVICPNFTTYADVWVRVWECLAPYMEYFEGDYDDYVDNVHTLKEYIKMAPDLKKYTTWLKPSGFTDKPAVDMSATAERVNVTSQNGGTSANRVQVTGDQTNPQANLPSWATGARGNTTPSWAGGGGMYTTRRITVRPVNRPSWAN